MLGLGQLKRLYLNLTAPDGCSLNWSWQRCRRAFLREVDKVCVCCDVTKKIQVHHKLPRHIRPDLATVFSNLIALCRGCHLRIGHLGSYFTYNENVADVCWYVRHNSVLKDNKVARMVDTEKALDEILDAWADWLVNNSGYPEQILLPKSKKQALYVEAAKKDAILENGYYIEGEVPPKFYFREMEVVENKRDAIEFRCRQKAG